MATVPLSATRFRLVAWAEAATYLVLCCALIVRALTSTDLVPIFGPIHGIAYLAYGAAVLVWAKSTGWAPATQLVLLGAGILPLGTIWAERWARSKRRR